MPRDRRTKIGYVVGGLFGIMIFTGVDWDARADLVLARLWKFFDDRHARAELTDVVDDVRRQNDDAVLAELTEQIQKTLTLRRIQSCGWLVDY